MDRIVSLPFDRYVTLVQRTLSVCWQVHRELLGKYTKARALFLLVIKQYLSTRVGQTTPPPDYSRVKCFSTYLTQKKYNFFFFVECENRVPQIENSKFRENCLKRMRRKEESIEKLLRHSQCILYFAPFRKLNYHGTLVQTILTTSLNVFTDEFHGETNWNSRAPWRKATAVGHANPKWLEIALDVDGIL